MITRAEVIALGVTLPPLNTLFVALRFYVKRNRTEALGIDDFLILITLLCVCGLCAICIYGAVRLGLGGVSPHTSISNGINTEDDYILTHTKKLVFIFNEMSPWIFGSAKLSVLFFYRTVFFGRVFNILSRLLIAVVSVWIIVSYFFLLLQCGSHVWFLWSSAANIAQNCLSGFRIAISIAATDVFTDLLIILMPIYWVLKLHLPLDKRISICGVFLFGAGTIASSLLRLAEYGIVYPGHNTDPNQYAYLTTIIYYGTIEAGLCIIAACLPTLGPLFSSAGRDRLRSKSRYKGSNPIRSTGSLASSRFQRSNYKPTTTATSFADTAKLNFAPNTSYDDSIGLDTIAVGNNSSEVTDHLDEERNIVVTTDINQKVSPIASNV